MTTKMSQEAKKDEFRKYLDKAGALELLTKSLVQLYEVILFIIYSFPHNFFFRSLTNLAMLSTF